MKTIDATEERERKRDLGGLGEVEKKLA